MTKQEMQSHLSTETKYSKTYLKIIANAQQANRTKLKKDNKDYVYYESHHILPKSIFPEYEDLKAHKWNGVLLNAREHYIIHSLIWKHYKKLDIRPQVFKMAKAFQMMQTVEDKNQQRYTSKLYEVCRVNIKQSKEAIDKHLKTMAEINLQTGLTKREEADIKMVKSREINKESIYNKISSSLLKSDKIRGKNHNRATNYYVFDLDDNFIELFSLKQDINKKYPATMHLYNKITFPLYCKNMNIGEVTKAVNKNTWRYWGWYCVSEKDLSNLADIQKRNKIIRL